MSKRKKIILCVTLPLLLVVALLASYVLYVFCSYYRVEDGLHLKTEGSGTRLSAVPVGERLTALTYNIGFGAYGPGYSFFMDGGEHSRALSREEVIKNTEGAIGISGSVSADFMLFQEVDVCGTRSYKVDQTEYLADAYPDYERSFAQNYDSPYFLYPFGEPIGANYSGLMTLSAYDIEDSLRVSLPVEDSLYKLLDLDRCYSRYRIPASNGRSLVLYNVHLSAYTSDGSIADEQLRLLSADMASEYSKGNYVIAGGDFNKDLLGDSSEYFTRPRGEEYTWAKPLKVEDLPEGFSVYTGENAPTCRNADSPYRGDGSDFVLSVDGFIVSPNVEVVSHATRSTGFSYSDHDPAVLEFILTE